MKDETFFLLMQEALNNKISVGKLLNNILNDYVKKDLNKKVKPAICNLCGKQAAYVALIHGKWINYCEFDMPEKSLLKAYKKIGK